MKNKPHRSEKRLASCSRSTSATALAARACLGQIRIGAINESTPLETVCLAAERALPKVEVLLEAALEQIPNGSALPLVFTLVLSLLP